MRAIISYSTRRDIWVRNNLFGGAVFLSHHQHRSRIQFQFSEQK